MREVKGLHMYNNICTNNQPKFMFSLLLHRNLVLLYKVSKPIKRSFIHFTKKIVNGKIAGEKVSTFF